MKSAPSRHRKKLPDSRGRPTPVLRGMRDVASAPGISFPDRPQRLRPKPISNILRRLEVPDRGIVAWNGRDVSRPHQPRKLMMQKDALLPWRTMLDNAILGRVRAYTAGRPGRRPGKFASSA